MLSFSYATYPRAVIVKCDGCAYDVDVELLCGLTSDQMKEKGYLTLKAIPMSNSSGEKLILRAINMCLLSKINILGTM